MTFSKRALVVGSGVAALLIAAVPAVAAHGKAGLWDVTVSMNMSGMPGMPDMSKLPPEAQAAMKAHGVTMNGNSMTVQHCMTQAEVDANGPPPMRNMKECQMANVQSGATSFTADMTCSGRMTGTGHIQVSFDSPEHYAGKVTITGSADDHPFGNITSFEGHWIGADCKGVTH